MFSKNDFHFCLSKLLYFQTNDIAQNNDSLKKSTFFFFLIIYLAEKKIQKLKNIKNVIKLSIKLYVGFLLSFQEIFLK